ncbi:MAG: carboxymuconolactone decarboxylase family protein [Pseudomonadota bacterium]
MSARLTPLIPDDLSVDAQKLYIAVTESPRAQGPGRSILVRQDGTLCGPFDAWLRTPGLGLQFEKIGMLLRTETVLAPAVREIIILTVAVAWHIDFEFQVHAMVALNTGVDSEVVEAIATGKAPSFQHDDLAIAYTLTNELIDNREVIGQRISNCQIVMLKAWGFAGSDCFNHFRIDTCV